MLWIHNVSPPGRPDDQPHDYTVQINREPPLARFQHVRNRGAAECLRAAADAIDAQRPGDIGNPISGEEG